MLSKTILILFSVLVVMMRCSSLYLSYICMNWIILAIIQKNYLNWTLRIPSFTVLVWSSATASLRITIHFQLSSETQSCNLSFRKLLMPDFVVPFLMCLMISNKMTLQLVCLFIRFYILSFYLYLSRLIKNIIKTDLLIGFPYSGVKNKINVLSNGVMHI